MERDATHGRTIVYVDGFNLYYGMRDAGLRHCYWLDVHQLAQRLVGRKFKLVATKYFTARIAGARKGDDAEQAAARNAKRLRQQTYLEALAALKWLRICEGKYLLKRAKCGACNTDYLLPEEKMTDVNIATELLVDAYHDRFDSAIIVSGDSDLAPPIIAVRNDFPHKPIIVAFPSRRFSLELKRVASATVDVYRNVLQRCQLSDFVAIPGGVKAERPTHWR